MVNDIKVPHIILALLVALQVLFWYQTVDIKPKLDIVPPLPSEKEVAALSFGDSQFYFRALAFNLQMAGDTFGRSTPLKDYNYPKLLEWFRLLDRLDENCLPPENPNNCRASTSNYVPSLAAYYFSKSQNNKDVKYVLDYLEEHSMRNPEANWWWLSQSIYLANSVLRDKPRAIRIATELHKIKADMPLWARQMVVFLREDIGEKSQAEEIMCETLLDYSTMLNNAPKRERDFMLYYFQTRMHEAIDYKPGMSDEQEEKKMSQLVAFCKQKYFNKQQNPPSN